MIGTVNIRYGDHCSESAQTTPEASDLQGCLKKMHSAGVTHVAMEVSSHALDLERVRGCHFRVAVFTNLSRDHLDFHGDIDHYAAAKALLFSRELVESRAEPRVAVVNRGDPRTAQMLRGWSGRVLSFGLDPTADVHPEGEAQERLDGITARVAFPGGTLDLRSPLPGRHNLLNCLTAVAIGRALDLPADGIARGIESCRNVPGRLERADRGAGPAVFIDYAHTDDALRNVLGALRPLTAGRLIVVFGCGGDRDRGKRPLMGAAVADGADLAVVTSDNPRTEKAEAIIEAILPGLNDRGWRSVTPDQFEGRERGAYTVIPDRREAIHRVVKMARHEDVVLIAGKGHETYQLIGSNKTPFDDRQEAREGLAQDSLNSGKEAK